MLDGIATRTGRITPAADPIQPMKNGRIVPLAELPQYGAAAGKLAELQTRMQEIDARLASHRIAQTRKVEIERAAVRLLDTGADQRDDERAELLDEKTLRQLDQERVIVARAIELQRVRMEALASQAAAAVGREIAPQIAAIIGRVSRALGDAADALDEHRAMFEELRTNGYPTPGNLATLAAYALGSARDDNSRVSAWLRDAAEEATRVKALARS